MKKKIVLIVSVVFASICTMAVFFLACEAGVQYGIILIREEQRDHYQETHAKIADARVRIAVVQRSLDDLYAKKTIAQSDKIDVLRQLRAVEEMAAEITRETVYYDEDLSVHLFFAPEGYIVAYFQEVRNTPLYINRYVRSVEQGLFIVRPSQDQYALIQKNADLLQEELERLSVIVPR